MSQFVDVLQLTYYQKLIQITLFAAYFICTSTNQSTSVAALVKFAIFICLSNNWGHFIAYCIRNFFVLIVSKTNLIWAPNEYSVGSQ